MIPTFSGVSTTIHLSFILARILSLKCYRTGRKRTVLSGAALLMPSALLLYILCKIHVLYKCLARKVTGLHFAV